MAVSMHGPCPPPRCEWLGSGRMPAPALARLGAGSDTLRKRSVSMCEPCTFVLEVSQPLLLPLTRFPSPGSLQRLGGFALKPGWHLQETEPGMGCAC